MLIYYLSSRQIPRQKNQSIHCGQVQNRNNEFLEGWVEVADAFAGFGQFVLAFVAGGGQGAEGDLDELDQAGQDEDQDGGGGDGSGPGEPGGMNPSGDDSLEGGEADGGQDDQGQAGSGVDP